MEKIYEKRSKKDKQWRLRVKNEEYRRRVKNIDEVLKIEINNENYRWKKKRWRIEMKNEK